MSLSCRAYVCTVAGARGGLHRGPVDQGARHHPLHRGECRCRIRAAHLAAIFPGRLLEELTDRLQRLPPAFLHGRLTRASEEVGPHLTARREGIADRRGERTYHSLEARVGGPQAPGEILLQLAEQPVLDGREQLFLAVEPAVDRANRHARPFRDRRHGELVEPVSSQHVLGGSEDLLQGFPAACLQRRPESRLRWPGVDEAHEHSPYPSLVPGRRGRACGRPGCGGLDQQ